jgi:ketopantoate reductase
MEICIDGAGATGGYFGALVAQRATIAGLYEGIVRPAETKAPVFA